jgi:SAM-dependent methyltransferase
MLHFLGIGAQKAGTTWLYTQLSAHPQVRFPAGKELHFWDSEEERDVAQYKRRFDQPVGGDIRSGEITPAYAILSRERVVEIYSHFPSLRLLYLIRNPIERAWSSALMALNLAEMQIDEVSDQWFIDHFRSRGSLRRGDYEACIRTWRSVYPKEQLLILRYEAIAEEPRGLLESVATHLGIDAGFFSSPPEDMLNRRIFAGNGVPLRPSLRAVLERLYSEKVQALSAFLGMDLGWTPLIRPSAGALLKGGIPLGNEGRGNRDRSLSESVRERRASVMKSCAYSNCVGIDPICFVPNADLYGIARAPYLWNIDFISMDEQSTHILGWCLPHAGLIDNTRIRVNGKSYLPVRGEPKGSYAELYPWHPNAAYSGFSVSVPHWKQDLRKETELCIACVSAGDDREDDGYTLDVLVADLSFEIPPPNIAARIGVVDLLHYVMYGRSIFRGLEKALVKNFGTSFSDYRNVLDWGCGSARVARHTIKALGTQLRFIGVDIDRLAIDWANKEVGPHFRVCERQPPLEVPDGSVDLVYAYSVFTHLAEANFKLWIVELARILEPGGVALFTVLSDRAMIAAQCGLSRSALEEWNSTGIHDSMQNSQLETIGVSGDYYRNVWIKQQHLATLVQDYFDILDYIGCFHFYQDLVVARRKAAHKK